MNVKQAIKKYGDICVAVIALAALVIYEGFLSGKIGTPPVTALTDGIITRALGSVVAVVAVKKSGYKVFNKSTVKAIIAILPCFLAVACNPPLIGLITGDAALSYSGTTLFLYILLFIAECLLVGVFEELLFRGILFPAVEERLKEKKRGRFFGYNIGGDICARAFVQFVHLIADSGFNADGVFFFARRSVLFHVLKTENILYCVLLHASFNFCGGLTGALGYGGWGGVPSYVFSAVVCVLVAVYVLFALLADDDKK